MKKKLKSGKKKKALSAKGQKSKLSVHDKLFKALLKLFEKLGLLEDFVLCFVFTEDEQQKVKIKDVRIVSGSSTGNGFSETHADMTIAFILLIANMSRDTMIVLEHKSHQGKDDLDQIKTYCERLAYDNKCPVIPVFFHHGEKAWNKPLFCQDQFEVLEGIPQTLLPFLKFFYRLIEVQNMDIRQIENSLMRISFFAFQQIWNLKKGKKAKLRVLEEFFEHAKVARREHKRKYRQVIKILLAYFLEYDHTLTWEVLGKIAKKTGYYKEGGEKMEYLRHTEEGAREIGRQEGLRKGLQKGRKEGRQEGRKEGRQEGQQNVILNMLKKKMDLTTIIECTGVSKKQVLELQKQAGL